MGWGDKVPFCQAVGNTMLENTRGCANSDYVPHLA